MGVLCPPLGPSVRHSVHPSTLSVRELRLIIRPVVRHSVWWVSVTPPGYPSFRLVVRHPVWWLSVTPGCPSLCLVVRHPVWWMSVIPPGCPSLCLFARLVARHGGAAVCPGRVRCCLCRVPRHRRRRRQLPADDADDGSSLSLSVVPSRHGWSAGRYSTGGIEPTAH